MNLFFKSGFALFLLVTLGGGWVGICSQENSPVTSEANEALERVLLKLNAWRSVHTNAIFKFKLKLRASEVVVTSCYLGGDYKTVVQAPGRNNSSYVEFSSPEGDHLYYLPTTQVTLKEPDLLKSYIYKELAFCQSVTVAKVEHFGGKLEYSRNNDRDCLIVSIPVRPFSKTESKEPVTYVATHEWQVDDDGKVVRQTVTFLGKPGDPGSSMSSDLEYITFDREKVKATYDSILVKSVVDEGITFDAAIRAEYQKNSTTSSLSPGQGKMVIVVFAILALIPIGAMLTGLFKKPKAVA